MSGLTGLSCESGLSVIARADSIGLPVGTAAWYRCGAEHVDRSGSLVNTLFDLSGYQRHMHSSGSVRPLFGRRTLNGLPLLTFNKDYLQCGQPFNAAACAFVVTRANGSRGDRRSTAIHGAAAPNSNGTFIRANAVSVADYDISINGYPSVNSGAASVWGGPLRYGLDVDLGLDMRRRPGPLLMYAQYKAPNPISYLGRLWALIGSRWRDRRARVDLAEIVFWPTIPTTAQRQRVEGMLALTWGLSSNLVSGHPYHRGAS